MKATAIEIWPTSAENHLPVGSSSPNSNKHERRYTANIYNSGRWCFSICIYVILYEYIYIYIHIYTYIYISPSMFPWNVWDKSFPQFPKSPWLRPPAVVASPSGADPWRSAAESSTDREGSPLNPTFCLEKWENVMFNGNVWEIRTFLESSKFSQHKSSP